MYGTTIHTQMRPVIRLGGEEPVQRPGRSTHKRETIQWSKGPVQRLTDEQALTLLKQSQRSEGNSLDITLAILRTEATIEKNHQQKQFFSNLGYRGTNIDITKRFGAVTGGRILVALANNYMGTDGSRVKQDLGPIEDDTDVVDALKRRFQDYKDTFGPVIKMRLDKLNPVSKAELKAVLNEGFDLLTRAFDNIEVQSHPSLATNRSLEEAFPKLVEHGFLA